MKPRQFDIYKGKTGKFGALQMNLVNPESDGYKLGCVFLEVTSTKAPDVYDWPNSIKFKLGVPDLSQLVFGMKTMATGGKIDLIHDPGAGTDKKGQIVKTLNISSPKGPRAGVMITLSQKAGDEVKRHTVPMSGHEALAFSLLLERALVAVHGW